MCDHAVTYHPPSLQFVPDWFVAEQQLKRWCDDECWYDDDMIIGRYDGYKKRRTHKVKIKEEFLPITWHPSRYWDWCISEEEKTETEKLWV